MRGGGENVSMARSMAAAAGFAGKLASTALALAARGLKSLINHAMSSRNISEPTNRSTIAYSSSRRHPLAT